MKAGDLLIKLDGATVKDASDLHEAVRDLEGGKAVPLTVWREGRSVDLSLTLSDEPRPTRRRSRPVS